jgi:hypothetical protein
MGARYRDLKNENREMRAAVEGFVSKVSLKPGDMVVFKVDPKSIGTSFGVGWGCMDNISAMMSQMAGGAVRVIATTDRNPFDVSQLDKFGRAKLRALLDQLDALARQANPTGSESSIPRGIATPR